MVMPVVQLEGTKMSVFDAVIKEFVRFLFLQHAESMSPWIHVSFSSDQSFSPAPGLTQKEVALQTQQHILTNLWKTLLFL